MKAICQTKKLSLFERISLIVSIIRKAEIRFELFKNDKSSRMGYKWLCIIEKKTKKKCFKK